MKEEKMHLVNKIFNNETIRTVWDKKQEKYFISVVDIVRTLTNSNNPQTYWIVFKKRLKDEGNEIGESVVTNSNALNYKYIDTKRIKFIKDNNLNN